MNIPAFPAPAASTIFARSMAVNLPLVGLVTAAGLAVWHLIRRQSVPDIEAEQRAKFKRAILADKDIDDRTCAFWMRQDDPIGAARAMILEAKEGDKTMPRIRAALAASI
jgi:hypothetical protein